MSRRERGFSVMEMMVATAIMAVASLAFANLLRYVMLATTVARNQGLAQEDTRQALAKIETALIHANEIRVASSTCVEFVVDLDRSPLYDPQGDPDGDGIPNFRDTDRDNDAHLLLAATQQWRIGFNLKDDDEDGDARTDVRQRLCLAGRELWLDTSVNEAGWGGPYRRRVATEVSTFTLTYHGNRANDLGKSIDADNDGSVSAAEMDGVLPPLGMGNGNAALDLANERRYITSVRLHMAVDKNRDGRNDYALETDVYPPLLPLKSR